MRPDEHLRFLGRPGVVEIVERVRQGRNSGYVYWRFSGFRLWAKSKTRGRALIEASWACKRRACDCDWRIYRETNRGLASRQELRGA